MGSLVSTRAFAFAAALGDMLSPSSRTALLRDATAAFSASEVSPAGLAEGTSRPSADRSGLPSRLGLAVPLDVGVLSVERGGLSS